VPADYLARFLDTDFPLPPNYQAENDPYADDWAKLSPEQRAALPSWMRIYYAMTANLDWNLGRLLRAVDELGLRENTIFIFTSDHGEMFGAQGRRAKNIFYDEAVRVPFLLRWPGHAPAGHVADACLNSPDIMPTLLGLLDLPIPDGVEGMDLSHCALGQDGPEPEAALLQGMGATAVWEDGHEWRGLRSKRYTYATYRIDGAELLFDNVADPYQMTNLADDPDHADTLERFRTLLRARLEAIHDRFEACTWYEEHWTRDRLILRTATT
jgi:arylsulfatase A-like enzyme